MKNSEKNVSLIKISIFVISLIIIIVAFSADKIFSDYTNKNFLNYSKNIAETISYEASAIVTDTDNVKTPLLETIAKSNIHNNKNILMIEFSNSNGDVFISNQSGLYSPEKFEGLKVNTPISVLKNDSLETVGYIKVYISNKDFQNQLKKQKTLIYILFFIVWITFVSVIWIYKILLDRELYIIYLGLKRIVDGQFGTKIKISGNKQTNDLINIFNDLSLRLKRYEEQNVESVLLERNKLEAILMSIINGVVVCDNDDNIVLINSAAEKMLNVNAETVTGVQIQYYSDTDGVYCFRDKIEEFKDTPLDTILKNPPSFNITVDKRIIKCIISPIFMQNDDYLGYIIVMLDVTKETEVNNLKNQFISNVSHELRTPVTVLRTYIDTLYTMGDELDETTRKEFTETINKEVTRLHRMVNDILDVSRLEAPDIEIEKEFTDIISVVKDTISSMQILANEKQVKIVFDNHEEELKLPINVVNMERVFNNLISNAIKYSPEKETITVKLIKNSEYVDISVTDKGCGIDEQHLSKLFTRFYRVENSVHTVKGTGLGLYLVKTTVEKHHNGKVYVNSKVGEGSTFGIKLPLS